MPNKHQVAKRSSTWPKTGRSSCKICNNLDAKGHAASSHDAEALSGRTISLSLPVDALQLKKSRAGCRFCSVLAEALDAFFVDWSTVRAPIIVDLGFNVPVCASIRHVRYEDQQIEIYTSPGVRSPWPSIGSAASIPLSPDSDASFAFAQRCIDDCVSKHTVCQEAPAAQPTRLLYVGKDKESPIKLCELPYNRLKYAALSHCWGRGPSITTTKANLAARKKYIDFGAMPALFQDAVIIARKLGIGFLWIDALCIIQDCRDDWETESANMMNIYRCAHITISAVHPQSSDERIFAPRRKPIVLEYKNTQGKCTYLRARKLDRHHPDLGESRPARPHGPLMSRAWVLQEHLLCTRILHYTETELVYECRKVCRCECTSTWRGCVTTPGLLSKVPKSEAWDVWHRITAQYSLRKLTVPSDKLPAISGIAQNFRSCINAKDSDYLAGLWKSNLPQGLLWSSDSSLSAPVSTLRLSTYRAPSFTWASVDTQIRYTHSADEDLISNVRIVSASCTMRGMNPFGEVSFGCIQLEGQLIEGSLSAPHEHEFEYALQLQNSLTTIKVAPDTLLVVSARLGEADESYETVTRGGPSDVYSPFDRVGVWCLNLVSSSHEYVSGLVLALSPRTAGAYERLGTFSCGHEYFSGAQKRKLNLV
ncbi:HET-domain-containing protein [Pseudovirgaria hyperparasitica]|uniref:HET-domain-containing protein n=1 Tax=Pseudovirgaria hyperparasitica TaxID=470096 RepID=A0A6A6WDP8_9PEZI|nr:HET-domain-containing protein [Pseudovirgaria hyperparasitica]KAF2759677.1 HET-domain-containing protein [Pseudovirgaria hyperparasitica]